MLLTALVTALTPVRCIAPRLLLVAAALLVTSIGVGCQLDASANADNPLEDAGETVDAGSIDGGASETAAAPDAPTDHPPDAADEVEAADLGPAFELGVNVTGTNTPEFFSKLEEGGDLRIEYGPQGLWMVVLAFRTRGMLTGDMALGGRVETTELLGELHLAKQKLAAGGDGWDYYYNFFLVIAEQGVGGQTATVPFDVTDEVGVQYSVTRTVRLVGGPDAVP